MTLGELIIEDRGKISGQRVLDVDDGPTIESSFSMEGRYKGIIGTDIETYWSSLRSGGIMYGEGQGIIATKENGHTETATWTGQGIGRFIGQGTISFRGSLFFKHH
jgi:hypothetical protein